MHAWNKLKLGFVPRPKLANLVFELTIFKISSYAELELSSNQAWNKL